MCVCVFFLFLCFLLNISNANLQDLMLLFFIETTSSYFSESRMKNKQQLCGY